ncbi:MAG: endolytic transglycosylase MltG [Clostridia bacterium]|nr:endolytic transglycosylase MltG [Clostridia bacterium]
MNGDFEIKEQKTPAAGKSPTGAERAQPSLNPENRPRRAARRIPEKTASPAAPTPAKVPEKAADRPVSAKKQHRASTRVNTAVVAGKPEPGEAMRVKKGRDATEEGGRHVSNVVKVIAYVTFVLVISALLSVFVIMAANDIYAFVKSDEEVEITIPEEATLEEVADLLGENRVIKYPGLFKFYAKIKKDPCDFRAGTYTVSPKLGYKELLSSFKPKAVSGVSWVTIPEGYTTDEIIDLLVEKGIGSRDRYVEVINEYDFDYWFVDEIPDNWRETGRIYRLDGYLFPDSYEFYNASSEETVINRMLKRFAAIFTKDYRLGAEEIGMTVDQVVTLASMIEKEAGTPSDFAIVSSVFHNRMALPWDFPYLESDATIVYVIQHETGKRPRLTSDDLAMDTPYNTYTNTGLPPGPIASPSNSAILAALNPVESGYYFFVSSGTRTYFSVTRAEHDAKVAEIMAGIEEDPYAPEDDGRQN